MADSARSTSPGSVRLTPEILIHILQIQAGDYEVVEPTQEEIDAYIMGEIDEWVAETAGGSE